VNQAALQRAIESLAVADVFARSMSISVAEGFEPKYESKDLEVAWRFRPIASRRYVLQEQPDDASPRNMAMVLVETSVRFLRAKADEAEETEARVRAQIDTVFCAEYHVTKELDDEAMDVFSHTNVMYHVWPYWRELIQTESMRVRLPIFTLPVFRVPKAPSAPSSSDDKKS
jgi:hypothetical protein